MKLINNSTYPDFTILQGDCMERLAEIEDKVQPERQTPLTPPGSLSFQHFAQHCTGCQLCISECPNEVLRPSSDLWHLMQPTMSYERGYCRPECNRCSEVCPAGAIKPLAHELKASTQIGHAVWIKKNCIPLTDGVECGNCARHCPVGAIEMVPSDPNDEESPYVPAVNENRCIGCRKPLHRLWRLRVSVSCPSLLSNLC